MTHDILLQNDVFTPLGRLRLAGVIQGGLGVEQAQPLRVYGSYAIMCLLKGAGFYREAGDRVPRPVATGDVILVFPEVAHWYGPLLPRDSEPEKTATGWDEFYITFDGPVFDLWRQAGLLNASHPIRRAPRADWAQEVRALIERSPAPSVSCNTRLRQVTDFLTLLNELLVDTSEGESENSEANLLPLWAVQACGLLDRDLARPLCLKTLAHEVGFSYESFRKEFGRVVGVSPAHYRATRRIEAARELLRYSPQMTNRQVAQTLGFADEYHFSKRFTQMVGQTPRAFRLSGRRNAIAE